MSATGRARPFAAMAAALGLAGLVLAGSTAPAQAGEPMERPVLIGVLTEAWGRSPPDVALRQGLIEAGYREGEDFVIGVRFTRGDVDALAAAAWAHVEGGAQLLFPAGSPATRAAMQVTESLPIVFAGVNDPVGEGLVESYAHPGGNVTGVADLGGRLGAKRLEMFRAILPGLQRVMYPYDARRDHVELPIRGYREAARRLGIELLERPVRTREEAQSLIDNQHNGAIDGFVADSSPSLNLLGLMLAAGERGIPTMFAETFMVETGGFASYGAHLTEQGRMAARLVAKIIEGADPAEIPVEVNNDIEFVVNLKTARALGIEIPPEVLFQADRIIR